MKAIIALLAFMGLTVDPPNPACLVPVPFHCDPPPDGDGPGREGEHG